MLASGGPPRCAVGLRSNGSPGRGSRDCRVGWQLQGRSPCASQSGSVGRLSIARARAAASPPRCLPRSPAAARHCPHPPSQSESHISHLEGGAGKWRCDEVVRLCRTRAAVGAGEAGAARASRHGSGVPLDRCVGQRVGCLSQAQPDDVDPAHQLARLQHPHRHVTAEEFGELDFVVAADLHVGPL